MGPISELDMVLDILLILDIDENKCLSIKLFESNFYNLKMCKLNNFKKILFVINSIL